MKKQNPNANGTAMPKSNNFQRMLWLVVFVFCCFTTNSLTAGELPQCEVTATVTKTNPTNGSNGSIHTDVYGGNGHCLIYRLWDYGASHWYTDYQTSSDFHNLPAGTYGVKKYSDPNCDGHYGDASCYQKLGEVQLVNEAPSCNPIANVVNNGPCPINVYEWLDTGDVYLTTIAAGASAQIDAYEHMMLRFVDEVNEWSNLLFDEHVTVGCDDQTFNVTPNNYCGHVDPVTPPAPPTTPGTPTPNPVGSADLTCPADTTVDCDGSIDPAATGSASTDAANYDISYTDAVSQNGCEDVIVRTWNGVYTGSETSFTEVELLNFDMEACESYANHPSSSDMSEFTAAISADGVSASFLASGTQMHSCVTDATGGRAVCIDANDDCSFSWNDEDVASFQMAVTSAPGESFKISKLSFDEVAPTWVEWANDHNNYPTQYGIRILKDGQEVYVSEGNATTQDWTLEEFALDGAEFTVSGSATFTFQFMGYCKNQVNNNSIEAWDLDNIKVFGGQVSNIFSDDISCTQTITRPNGVSVTAEAANGTELTCEISSLTLTASASNGASISWEGPNGPAGTGASIEATSAGIYTATADCDCSESASITITEDATAPSGSAANDGPLTCDHDNVEISATGGDSYSWSGPNGFSATGATASVTEAGTYTVTISSANGCTDEASTVVEENIASPNPVASNDGPFTCDNDSVEISASGGASYEWAGPNGFSASTAVASVTEAGTYTVTVAYANGCSETASTTVEADDSAPTASASNDGPITCDHPEVALSANGGGSYAWSGPAGFASNEQNPSTSVAGTYTVVITADNGCTDSASTTVEEDTDAPAVSADNDGPITCEEGDTITISASADGNVTYAWTGPNGFVGGDVASAQVSEEGEYIVTVTDANGCQASASTTVEAEMCMFDLALTYRLTNGTTMSAERGDDVHFKVKVFNQGTVPANNVTIVSTIPAGLELNDADWAEANGKATITLPGTIAAGDMAMTDITFTVADDAPDGFIVAIAEIMSADDAINGTAGDDKDSTPDMDPTNDAGGEAGTATDNQTDGNGTDDEDDQDPVRIAINVPLAGLGDYTFIDENENGIQDAGDQPLEDVLVKLFDAADPSTVLAQITTNSAGYYEFVSLDPDKDYKVMFTAPDGFFPTVQSGNASEGGADDSDADEVMGMTDVIDLEPGEFDETIDAGFIAEPELGTIGDFVWMDNNANGQQDPGEMALAGVTVTLIAEDGSESTMVTDNNGGYDFTELPEGTYTVVVGDGPDGKILTTPGSFVVELAEGEDYNDADFGFDEEEILLGNIGDTVFFDDNNNGVQDAGEAGIPGVTVTLSGDANATLVTDNNGFYDFTGLPAGNYTSTVGQGPAGYEITTFSSDDITLAPGEDYNDADFGFYQEPAPALGTIGDTVFMDNNGNGVQDPGEMALSGITLTLIAADGTQSTTVTGANGTYDFTDLPAGVYMVIVGQGPDGKELTTPGSMNVTLAEGQDYNDADFGFNDVPVVCDLSVIATDVVDPTCANPFGGSASVIVTGGTAPYTYVWTTGETTPSVSGFPGGKCGVTVTDANGCTATIEIDLAVPACGTIGDTVFMDNNGDGFQNPGEMGLAGITVTLIAADGTQTSMLTNANGVYDFTGLEAGAYMVQVGQGPAGKILSTPGSYSVNLVQGEDFNNADFGFENEPVVIINGTIGDQVFWDANENGLFDAGEQPLPGTIVTLTAPNGTQSSLTTDANGYYDFTNLPAGAYTVTVGQGPADSYATTPTTFQVNLAQGEDFNTADFGFYSNPVVIVNGTIGDQVFWDANENGLFDAGEQPLAGIIVTLTAPNGAQSSLTTDANGYYDFTNLPAGTYTATVGQGPADSQLTTLGSFLVNLAQGQDYNDADFGFYNQPAPPAPVLGSIGDYTWIDANENQIQDAGELPIGNITVTLYFPDGSFQNAITDANGHYDFTGLPAGDYTVVAGLANGYAITTPGVDYVSLGAGEDYNAADFGYAQEEVIVIPPTPEPTGCIGEVAYLDENENGIQDAGEPGIANITMALYDENNNLQTTVTDENGFFEFCGLNAGNYSLVSGLGPQGSYVTTPSFYQVSLGQGMSALDLDFGYFVPVTVDCSGQTACVEELTPTQICPEFCNLADGSYTITSAHTTFDCSIQLEATCIIYTALPGMAGFPDTVTVTAESANGQTEVIQIAMTIGGCDDAPATGGIEPGPGVTPGQGGQGGQGGEDACGEINTCGAPMTAIVLCPEYCDLAIGSYEINNVESIFECNIEILDSNCIRYTPFPGFTGQEILDITACDDNGCETANAYILVSDDCEDAIPVPPVGGGNDCSADQVLCTLPVTPVDVAMEFCTPLAEIATLSSTTNANIVSLNGTTFRVIPLPGFSGIINIEVIGEDADGNTEIATVSVAVTDDCDGAAAPVIKSFVPNAFSPNGDGVNDVFKVENFDSNENVSFTVVDQTGKVVFQAPQFDGSWDGSYLGQSNTVPSGTYFYIASKGGNVQKGFIEIKK